MKSFYAYELPRKIRNLEYDNFGKNPPKNCIMYSLRSSNEGVQIFQKKSTKEGVDPYLAHFFPNYPHRPSEPTQRQTSKEIRIGSSPRLPRPVRRLLFPGFFRHLYLLIFSTIPWRTRPAASGNLLLLRPCTMTRATTIRQWTSTFPVFGHGRRLWAGMA